MKFREALISNRIPILISSGAFLALALILVIVFTVNNKETPSDIVSVDSESIQSQEVSIDSSYEENISDDSSIDVSDTFAESEIQSDVNSEPDSSEESSEESKEVNHGFVSNKFGFTYVYGDCGYEQFSYKTTAMERYVNSFNNLLSIIPESTNVYNITVPVSSTFASIPYEIYTADGFFNKSQETFVSTVESKLNNRVKNIPIVSKLEQQYDNYEYVYFRTDKNWTALGAYTAYTSFCESAGLQAYSLDSFPRTEVGKYLGRFYNATSSKDMKNNPDILYAYTNIKSVKTAMTVYDSGLVYDNYKLCNNDVSVGTAYDYFLGRTAGRYEISTTANGGSLLVIGDTSVHPIVPFLASHYSKIDIIDPNNFDGMLSEFMSNHKYDDVLTMCYSTNAVSGDYIPTLNILTGVTINE